MIFTGVRLNCRCSFKLWHLLAIPPAKQLTLRPDSYFRRLRCFYAQSASETFHLRIAFRGQPSVQRRYVTLLFEFIYAFFMYSKKTSDQLRYRTNLMSAKATHDQGLARNPSS